jgi:hypothetical protein
MKRSIKWNINDLSIVRPNDLRFSVDMIKAHIDAAVNSLIHYHEEKSGISISNDLINVATIEFKDNCIVLTIRDEKPEDKKQMPYYTKITFPGIEAYDLPEKTNESN